MSIIFSVVAFFLSRAVLLPASDMPTPTLSESVFLWIFAALESVSFGIGLTFAMYGKEVVMRMAASNRKQAYFLYGSIVWLLTAWLPYSTLFMNIGMTNLSALLMLSYFFHISLILAGLVVAYSFINPFITMETKKHS